MKQAVNVSEHRRAGFYEKISPASQFHEEEPKIIPAHISIS
jgi:hypothetical protein